MISSNQIQEIIGRDALSEHAMAEIISLGPSEEEFLEAYNRTVRGNVVGSESLRPAGATVLKLCEILNADESILPGEPDN